MKFSIILCCLCYFISSCKGEEDKKCNELFLKGNESLNFYYETEKQDYLYMAKEYIDSIDCRSFEKKTINIKVTILLLLKKYEEGANYVSSLDSIYFQKDYTKIMYLNRFKALESESKGDTIQRNHYYKEILSRITQYRKQYPSEEEALFDYYIVRSFTDSPDSIIKEIILLKNDKKYNLYFLDALIEALNTVKH